MLTLHHRENCPYSQKVRRFLEEHHLSYTSMPEPKLGSERAEVLGLKGTTSAEVPVLEDDGTVVQGSDAIIEWLKTRHARQWFGDPEYGLTRTLPGVSYEDAVPRVKAALATEGFGVLTEIDIKATLKAKLDEDFRPYVILGACNPPLAHQALSTEPAMGLLLPCNVVVTEEENGAAVVSAIDPVRIFSVVPGNKLEPVAKEVRARLRRVLAAI